ncbi:MAG: ATP-dependent zinc protease [Akkermansiaceae bacterium]
MSISPSNLITVGWREWVGLPDLGVWDIKAKIDSGARTSCLHTSQYEIFGKEGVEWVRFTLHPLKKNLQLETIAEAPVRDYRIVRDSGGHEEKRPFIQTTLMVGSTVWPIEISLSNRERMKFRMLLGRTSMANRVLIDCSRSYLSKPRPRLRKS